MLKQFSYNEAGKANNDDSFNKEENAACSEPQWVSNLLPVFVFIVQFYAESN